MNWKKLFEYLVHKEYIAGLSIVDNSASLILFSNKKKILAKLESKLEEGVVEKGELKKPEELKKVLESFKNSPELSKIKNLYVTLTISSDLVYHKIFDLPVVSVNELTEAVDLNLKMISPIKFEESYSDWELFKTIKKNELKYRVSAIFAKKLNIDPYLNILIQTGFIPLAVEFQAMSVWRLFSDVNILPEGKKSCLVSYVSSEGMDFAVMSKEGLKFDYFQNWQEAIKTSIGSSTNDLPIENIKREDFFKIFTEQSRKIMSFYINRFDDTLVCFYLLSPIYQAALEEIVSKQFNIGSSKKPLNFDYSPNFFSASGAALRGLIPRTDDIAPSLMGVGTEEEYRRRRWLSFVGIWNKIIIFTLGILVAAFFGVWLFFNFSQKNLESSLSNLNVKIDQDNFKEFQERASLVNLEINQITKAWEETENWSPFWEFLRENINKNNININKIRISPNENKVLFLGLAPSEIEMINFKNNLGQSGYFSNIEIPLQSIVKKSNGIEFNLNFKIEKLSEMTIN